MKKWGPSILIFVAGLLFGTAVGWRCCDSFKRGFHNEERRYHRMINIFSRKLDLTAEQREKVVKIFDEKRQKMKDMREEARPKMEALRESTRQEIRKILNPDQLEKFEKLEARWNERRNKRHGSNP